MCNGSTSTFTPAAAPVAAVFAALPLDPSSRHGYNVATALRGPDFTEDTYADNLKEMTTAVLRYFVGAKKYKPGVGNSDVMGIVNTPAEAFEKWDRWSDETKKGVLDLQQKWHFVDHFSSGLASVEELVRNQPELLKIVREYREGLRARGFRYI